MTCAALWFIASFLRQPKQQRILFGSACLLYAVGMLILHWNLIWDTITDFSLWSAVGISVIAFFICTAGFGINLLTKRTASKAFAWVALFVAPIMQAVTIHNIIVYWNELLYMRETILGVRAMLETTAIYLLIALGMLCFYPVAKEDIPCEEGE